MEKLVGHIELVVLCVLSDTLKVLQLDTQDHVFALCQQMDMVIAQPELTSTAEEKVVIEEGGWIGAKGIEGIDYKQTHILVHLIRKWDTVTLTEFIYPYRGGDERRRC